MIAPSSPTAEIQRSIRGLFSALHIIRVPLIVSLVIAFFLTSLDQTLEIYRAIEQDISFYASSLKPIVSLIVAYFYALPSQTSHYFGAVALQVSTLISVSDKYQELAIGGLGILGMGLSVWFVTRTLATKALHQYPMESSIGRLLLACAPVMLFLLVVLSGAAGIHRAQTPKLDDSAREAVALGWRETLNLDENTPEIVVEVLDETISDSFNYNGNLRIAAIVVAIGAIVIASVLVIRQAWSIPSIDPISSFLGTRSKWLLFIAFVSVFAAVTIWPVSAPRLIGPLGVFSVFIVFLIFLTSLLSSYGDKVGVPLISTLLVWALLLSLFEGNDNHKIYMQGASSDESRGPRASLDEQFLRWYSSRQDHERYAEKDLPYPMYVIAVPGGGIYAAFHAASQLGSLQDHCPFFAHHTFAISGVSGGSVGAAVYSAFLEITAKEAMAKAKADSRTCVDKDWRPAERWGVPSIVELIDRALSNDFLSPLFAGVLFPDFVQSFVPVLLPTADRARRLELVLEQGVEQVLRNPGAVGEANIKASNLLMKPYIDHWEPQGNTPALVINTTEVDSGRRRIISPFEFGMKKELRFMPLWREVDGDSVDSAAPSGMPLSTAAILSARFPWITPSGWFYEIESDLRTGRFVRESGSQERRRTKIRLVDGAYFENSGVATALDLINAMNETAKRHGFADKILINLIVLTKDIGYGNSSSGLNEATAPVRALLNARTARGPITIGHAEDSINRAQKPQFSDLGKRPLRLRKILLKDMGYRVPLGWRLSPISLYLIRAQNGRRRECLPDANFRQLKSTRFDGDCIYDSIARELEGDPSVYPNSHSTTEIRW